MVEFANILETTPSNLMYKYVLDQEIGILPRTSNLTHLVSNYKLIGSSNKKIFDINFNNANIGVINKFDIGYRIY